MATAYVFALVNILGGISVLASYIWGLSSYPEHREALWGGIFGAWRGIFLASMMLAAMGYLAFAYYEFFKSGAGAYQETGVLGPYTVSIICAVFLSASTVWMPATLAYINTQQFHWWVLGVASLWVTVASLLLVLVVVVLDRGYGSGMYHHPAIAGVAYILFHCLVFDAIIWAVKFPKLG